MAKQKRTVALVTPALPEANNGNSHTAARWEKFLASKYHVKMVLSWDQSEVDFMIALHARRSAKSIEHFAKTHKPIGLVLTGTDLYRDILTDSSAARSLELAHQIVTLQPAGMQMLSASYRAKTQFIYQSAPQKKKIPSRRTTFDLALVGHIRPEKDPLTALRAIQLLAAPAMRLRVIGNNPHDALGQAVIQLAAQDPRIELLGGLSHSATRREISRARLLVLPSTMEGGANVLIEAITSGTPVLASDVNGNVGMLGQDYSGYFELGNAAALARLIERAHCDSGFYDHLWAQCKARQPLFAPKTEAAGVLALAARLLAQP